MIKKSQKPQIDTEYVDIYKAKAKHPDYMWRDEIKERIGEDADGNPLYRTRIDRHAGYYNHKIEAYEAYYTDSRTGEDIYYATLHLPVSVAPSRDNLMTRLLQIAPRTREDRLRIIQFRHTESVK